ncbi:hypothetical protein J7384_08460 [Endozoicomonas sp. G2_1]|uniref:hypothetical protein n=1 Tax=Endozoicomonas sp. G2_1 TaxID=2821091 RepID=UPI001ADB28E7|nr:hypothetical protein [Endozoicomonas sp. G2_1]MBO9490391.1 hypothetical protein [Endozoicomonas sp. G2_1]
MTPIKSILYSSLFLSSFTTVAADRLAYEDKIAACNQIDGIKIYNDTGRYGIFGQMVNFHLIKNDDVSHMLIGTSQQISNKKQFYCEFPDFNAKSCLYGTGQYSYWEASDSPNVEPNLIRNWEKDGYLNRAARDFDYRSNIRGTKYITTVVTEREFKTLIRKGVPAPKHDLPEGMAFEFPTVPFFHGFPWLNEKISDGIASLIRKQNNDGSIPDEHAHIPMCDSVKVHVQNPPTISKGNMSTFSTSAVPFNATVNYTYDTEYSYAALNNKPLKFTWIFQNIDYPSVPRDIVTTSTPYLRNFSPRTSGEHRVRVKISDGRFSATTDMGYVMFRLGTSGGGGGGSTCGPSGCGQIR